MMGGQSRPTTAPDKERTPPAFVDTHTHLDDPAFDADREEVVARAVALGVRRMVNIGYAPARWHSTIELTASTPGIAFTIGLHPGHADEWTDDLFSDIASLATRHTPAAIGEIGLDFAQETPDPARQRSVFEAQLALAQTLELPVVIHQRAAGTVCAAVLATTSQRQTVVLHSFDGNGDLLELGLERGWIFGVGGLMTRRNSGELRVALARIPLAQMVLETDSPYLVPQGVKVRRNTPEFIPEIARFLAELLQRSVAEVAVATTVTAEQTFKLKGCSIDA